jgi:hypothetical protein
MEVHQGYAARQTWTRTVDEEGNPCTTVEAQQQRWRRHFTKILNTQSQFNEAEIKKARQRPVRHQLDERCAMLLATLRMGKLEVHLASYRKWLKQHLLLVQATWKEGEVPREWSDALLIPIPKKGDPGKCDNWRGILLTKQLPESSRRGCKL